MRVGNDKYLGSILVAVMSMGLTNCIDTIPFEAEDENPSLVIFGTFTQLSQDYEVMIRRTSEFGTLGNPVRNQVGSPLRLRMAKSASKHLLENTMVFREIGTSGTH